ncbi:MAG: flippase [Planctomycetota bacterium]
MSTRQRLLEGSAIQIAARIVTAVVGFSVLALISRRLPKADFGVYSFYVTLFYILSTALDFGVSGIATREIAADPRRASRLLSSAFVFKLITGVLATGTAIVIALTLEPPGWRWMIVFAAAYLPTHAFQTASVMLQVETRFLPNAFAMLLGTLIFLLWTVLLAVTDHLHPGRLLIAFAVTHVLTHVTTWLIVRRTTPIAPWLSATWRETRAFLREAAPWGVSSLLTIGYYYADMFLLRLMRGDVELALYNAPYRIMNFPLLVPASILLATFPVLSRLHAHEPAAFGSFYRRLFHGLMLLALPVAAAAVPLRDELVTLAYSDRFADSASCFGILIATVPALFAGQLMIHGLIAIRRQSTALLLTALGLAGNVVMNLVLIPEYGRNGAAIATLITESAIAIGAACLIFRATGESPLSRRLMWPLMIGALVAGASWMVRGQPIWIWLPIPILVFLVSAFRFGDLPPEVLARIPFTRSKRSD